MTKMDEAVADGLEAAAALNAADYGNTQPLVAAFHRAIRERGYVVIEIERLEELATASVQGMAMIAAARNGEG